MINLINSKIYNIKNLFIVFAVIFYAVLFLFVYAVIGRGVGALAIIPVIAIGWAFGLWGGIISGVLSFPYNWLLLYLLGDEGLYSFIARAGGVAGSMALVLIGGVVGRMSELSNQVKRELAERKSAESELRETKDFLENVIESSLDSIVITDEGGAITKVNRAFLSMLGYAEAEAIGQRIHVLFVPQAGSYESTTGKTIKIDASIMQETRQIIEKLLKEGTISSWETYYVNKQVKVIPVEQNAVVLYDKNHARIGSVCVIRNITERKKAEEKLRETSQTLLALIEASPLSIVVLDTQCRVTLWNPAAEKMFGWTSSEAYGMDFPFEGAQSGSEFLKVFQAAMQGKATTDAEMPQQRKDGSFIELSLSSAPLLQEDGRVGAIMTIMSDITEQKRLQKEILLVSGREQRRIGQDLHDGLGQVLTGVGFMSRVLERKLTGKALPEAEEAGVITRLVNDAIGQTRSLARGLYPVTLQSDGLMAALEELASITENLFNISCKFNYNIPVTISDSGMAIHLYRIVQEAMNNAVRHGKAKHILISLDAEESKNILTIQDDGAGMETPLPRNKGMGINLMHYRAKMVGGFLEIRDAPGHGTTITCTFSTNSPLRATGEN